jgi:lambda repressor-like predicted transcriptional regulator
MGKALTISSIARLAGIERATVRDRLAREWPVERILSAPALPQTLSARAREAGLSIPTVHARRQMGWPEDMLLAPAGSAFRKIPSSHKNSGNRTRDFTNRAMFLALTGRSGSRREAAKFMRDLRLIGVGIKSRAQKARDAGLPPDAVQARVEKGWSEERALSTPYRLYRGKIPLARKAREAGLKPATVQKRIESGWSEARALSTPPLG